MTTPEKASQELVRVLKDKSSETFVLNDREVIRVIIGIALEVGSVMSLYDTRIKAEDNYCKDLKGEPIVRCVMCDMVS